ncbi:sugar transferase [Aureibaculum sp. 2210JD6-5]|uniref:sugar transferase n=1 Tax=Aureibaculum sp. 2210JD6-5 TaxID=3103957 RepID=UPI002AAE82BD|nr:sugar transferase [Aureibaculum sp. 2210JD6-5]MDY7394018.1 sugar transferase [Aureibaculum sp. 2210JD6-5]
MIKNYSTKTLESEKFLDDYIHLKNDIVLNHAFQADFNSKNEDVSKLRLLTNKLSRKKNASDFSSLEKIRIVVDSLIGDVSENDVCKKEGVPVKVFSEWKSDFLEAFNKYSEIEVLQRALNSNNKELIVEEVGKEAYDFYKKFINISSIKNLIISKNKVLSAYSDFDGIENIVLLNKVNNFRLINKQFEEVNSKLPINGILLGNFETFNSRAENHPINKIPFISRLYFGFEFLFKRVFPKMPVLKKLYFFTTKGKNRLLSKAEALGRLVSCGFDIVDVKVIDGIHYFVAKKVKEPVYDMNPSYGPLFKMKRVGKNGKIIGVYKLRTMHPYSEYLQDYVLKLNGYSDTGKPADDFRLVPWGKVLRRYWVDELPQLINVFKGELKLVGARPVSQRYFQDIPEDLQKLRLAQKPGCVPPYVALDRKGAVDSVLQAEREYLQEKLRNPYTTDIKYFFKAIYNIVFKNKRSA